MSLKFAHEMHFRVIFNLSELLFTSFIDNRQENVENKRKTSSLAHQLELGPNIDIAYVRALEAKLAKFKQVRLHTNI